MLDELPKRRGMKIEPINFLHTGAAQSGLTALAQSDGNVAHPYLARLKSNTTDSRDLADAVHFLCILHGAHPSIVDEAAARVTDLADREVLQRAAQAFTAERAYLLQIAPAAGPAPSTPGHRNAETAAADQVRAVHTLAQSERIGVAYGASLAILCDWVEIRALLDAMARRFDVPVQPDTLPEAELLSAWFDQLASTTAVQRAMRFGAQQLFAQHRGLWSLLEARASARSRP